MGFTHVISRVALALAVATLACLIQCAPTAQITSGGRTHPSSNRLDSVVDERLGRVTGRIEAS